ncbi:MAG: ATP-binding protein [Kofleriaceae bacterium]|nr:ATP-binding protein [Kofleriaceae bacterium]
MTTTISTSCSRSCAGWELPGMARLAATLLAQAAEDNLTVLDVLHRLCDDEKGQPDPTRRRPPHPRGPLPEVNTVDGFDFDFDPVARSSAPDTSRFTTSPSSTRASTRSSSASPAPARPSLPARSPTAPAKALAASSSPPPSACSTRLAGAEIHGQLERTLRRYVRADYLVVDDFAVLAMDPAQAKLAFRSSPTATTTAARTCITTNRPFKDWPRCSPTRSTPRSSPSASPKRAELFVLDGKSYRNAKR